MFAGQELYLWVLFCDWYTVVQQINKDVLESSLHSFNLKNICWGFLKIGMC
jgi:hypothetical protein